ncbi:MAG TPA: hypothetical protein VFG68_02845 [Fimbriiglobus sp.]|nr:hypothetical protein [Fimbriiglobus sp.]
MELREALSQIAEIRARAAVAERFRGYRSVPVGTSGALAVLAAVVQPHLVPDPAADVAGYLALWVTTAAVGAAAAGSGLLFRRWSARHPLSRELTLLAVGQFAPCLAAGALVTLVVARHAPESARLLPGLWQVIFALGMFASCRLLPRATAAVAVFYLLAGTVNLAVSAGPAAFSPWAMGLPFGVGQAAMAAVLYWNLERDDGR